LTRVSIPTPTPRPIKNCVSDYRLIYSPRPNLDLDIGYKIESTDSLRANALLTRHYAALVTMLPEFFAKLSMLSTPPGLYYGVIVPGLMVLLHLSRRFGRCFCSSRFHHARA